jgi:hypothetical protein
MERKRDMFSPSSSRTPRDQRNLRRTGILQMVWVACLIANNASHQYLFTGPLRVCVALLPLAVGALVVWSYAHFVRHADDLQKAIQLNALAIGFGVSVVFTLAYPAIERLGLPHLEPNHFMAVGVLTYLLATAVYSIRYE